MVSTYTIPATPTAEINFIREVRLEQAVAEVQQLIRDLAALLEFTAAEMAVILAVPERTFARRIAAKPAAESSRFSKLHIERLFLLRAVAEHGLAVFEDQGKFNRWLRRPLPMLQQQSPMQVLDTATGFRLVDQLLGRIEYGVYS